MKIAFVIHHIHDWGGQERSTLEFIRRCAETDEVHLFAYSASGLPSKVIFHRVPLLFKKPFFVKDFFFRIFVKFSLPRRDFDVVNATGNCCFDSNVITIQFCQKRWAIERKKMRSPLTWLSPLKAFQSAYDVFWEHVIFRKLKDKHYIALSETVAHDLQKFYGLKKISVIPHGVDAELFKPDEETRRSTRQELGVSDDEKLLLFVGTFERKGLFFLIPAFANLARLFKIKLCVVGTGPVDRARAAARALNCDDRITFAGFTKQVEKYYQAADVFTLPSLYDPFGLVGIEALAAGLPSAVSRQSGCSSLIKEGVNGSVIETPDDSRDIERCLEKLVNVSGPEFEKMKKQARASVAPYTWSHVWSAYDKVFKAAAKDQS